MKISDRFIDAVPAISITVFDYGSQANPPNENYYITGVTEIESITRIIDCIIDNTIFRNRRLPDLLICNTNVTETYHDLNNWYRAYGKAVQICFDGRILVDLSKPQSPPHKPAFVLHERKIG